MSLNPTQLHQLVLSDRRHVSEHLASLNDELSEHINVVGSAGRRGLDKIYVGSHVSTPGKLGGCNESKDTIHFNVSYLTVPESIQMHTMLFFNVPP